MSSKKVKRFFFIFLICFLVFNVIASIVITLSTAFNGKYLSEYENIKGLKNKKLYMEEYPFKITRGYDHSDGNGMDTFIIEGRVGNEQNIITLSIGRDSYMNLNTKNQVIYKSVLTGDVFLKGASKEYYDSLISSFLFGIYLKVSLYFIIFIPIVFCLKK